jgi:hypothetical protein
MVPCRQSGLFSYACLSDFLGIDSSLFCLTAQLLALSFLFGHQVEGACLFLGMEALSYLLMPPLGCPRELRAKDSSTFVGLCIKHFMEPA